MCGSPRLGPNGYRYTKLRGEEERDREIERECGYRYDEKEEEEDEGRKSY
jgi:hypothetical protein